MNIRKLIRNFFGFSRAETNGFLILLPIIFIALFSEPVYRHWMSSKKNDYVAEGRYLDSLVASWGERSMYTDSAQQNSDRKLFTFNPNEATKDELIELGFSGMLASRIVNYRSKGGSFKIKKDLLKIYGIDSTLFDEVSAFILLPETLKKKEFTTPNEARGIWKKAGVVRFDINTTDTSQLKSIYGIGEKLSLRIIKYRESLGGFIRQDQLNEIFGLDSAVVNRLIKKSFVEENFQPVKLNLNTATEQELDKHPYLNRNETKAIVAYRFQHGKFTSIDELFNIQLLNKKTIDKIRHYITID